MAARPNIAVPRRDLLKAGALAGVGLAAGGLLQPAAALGAGRNFKTERVILVCFAGGVRARECIGTPGNVPNMMRIAERGVILPDVRAANLGHYGAALSIFTGVPEARGIRENGRGPQPTIFEYVRKHAELPAHEVWLSTTAGAQTVNFTYGEHADYGAEYGANLIGTDGLFNAEFRELIDKFGEVALPSDAEAARISKLVGSLQSPRARRESSSGVANDAEASQRIQRYILEELKGDTSSLTGPGSGDAKAIRVARNLLRLFKPKLTAIVLQNHDVAHGSFNGYVDVIRRNDRELGLLWDAVQADPELRDTTSMFILPEFGRDANLNERNGLDHGDGSDDLRKIFCVAAGPDFHQGRTIKKDVDSYDVCPTIATLLGAKAPEARGKLLKPILAR